MASWLRLDCDARKRKLAFRECGASWFFWMGTDRRGICMGRDLDNERMDEVEPMDQVQI